MCLYMAVKIYTSLPPLGQLLSLKGLSIQDMNDVKDVGFEFLGNDVAFPSLEILNFQVEVSLKAPLLSLRGLRINKRGNGLMRSLVRLAPSVTKLEIVSISGLTNEVWRGAILDLKAVEELKVKECNKIRYLLESKETEASSKVLVNLKKLEVHECKILVSLGEKDDEYNYGSNLLTSLSS
nr:hypothetical protein [Tanacetum cinerariifolium]